MKVYAIENEFGLENLNQSTRPMPEVGPGQVLIAMKAVAVNRRDLIVLDGRYKRRLELPLIPFSDGAGEVVEVGEGVTRVQVGERVMPIFAQDWIAGEPADEKMRRMLGGPLDGVLAEYVVVDQQGVVTIPEHLSYVEAATLPCAGVTAWNALAEHGEVTAGDVVVTQGTGGVSIFALQLAQHLGAEVIATSSSDAKLDRVRQLGAAHVINYRDEPQWSDVVREITGGRGADHIIDVGGPGTLAQSIAAVRTGGHITLIGTLGDAAEPVNLHPVHLRNIRLQGIVVGSREMFEHFTRALEATKLRPVVDRTFGFVEAKQALEYVRAGGHLGKVVIDLEG